MSQHSLMSTQERKMQAAAICREIHATDEPEMDLGKKVSAPREIMLEELSLASNRGSRLFKMRQKRSEKYTFESIQNEANTQHSNNAIYPGQDILSNVNDLGNDQAPKTVNSAPNPENIAPGISPEKKTQKSLIGVSEELLTMSQTDLRFAKSAIKSYGGPLKDVPAEKFNSTAMPRSYQSPWEQALINDPSLADTLVAQVPKPEPRHDIPQFKSFNRVAIPFGGFGKAPKVAVKPLDVDLGIPKPITPVADPVIKRPTFNRTASGWVNDSVPLRLHLEPISSMSSTFAPESDDL